MHIWGNCLVKNEDKFLWFAVSSVIHHLDKLLLWDTGSTDNTVKICELLHKKYPTKVFFEKHNVSDSKEVTLLRQKMLEQSRAGWIFTLDGDEVWWDQSIKSVTQTIKKSPHLDSIVVPFINLIGDIYHYQPKSAGQYKIDDQKGFLTIRAFNTKIPGLHVDRPYPYEGYFDKNNISIQELNKDKRKFLSAPYLHFTHLKRSHLVKNKKLKHDFGKVLPLDYFYPESFFRPAPDYIESVWNKYDLKYLTKSGMISPARKLKSWTS